MKTVAINDTFPGDSKGKTKTLPDDVAKSLIDAGWATEVAETKDDKAAEFRQDKTNKAATQIKTK